jgi:transcriptional regulator with GAF, ATPase, and Fis domain
MKTAVRHAGGNFHAAAKMIGLTYRQLAYRLKARK